ncbi:MAG: glycosyltransferase [Kiritimatiellae bacterium]|nr:glycosyltransferase [Kiritimatiellia bacterium]
MNILFYLHQYPAFGGIETVTTMLANAFADDGHNVTIVSFIHKDGSNLLERQHPSVKWHELPDAEIDADANRRALSGIIANFRPDKIIFQDSYANIQHVLFSALDSRQGDRGKKLFVAEHSSPVWSLGRRIKPLFVRELLKRLVVFLLNPYFRYRRFQYESRRRRELFDRAAAYVILSKNYERAIRRLVGENRMGKLHVIPNPTRDEPFVDMSSKKKQMLFVGSLIPTKGVDRLLAVWRDVSRLHPDWEFVIVGDGVERKKLEAFTAKEKLRHVRFEGFRGNPAPYYQAASIIVMASDFEGWPMVLGEAMGQGCVPVVYDSFAAASDIIDDGINGRVIRHFKHRKYVAAVEELMDNAVKRKCFAEAARQKAAKYCMENVKKEWYGLLQGGG